MRVDREIKELKDGKADIQHGSGSMKIIIGVIIAVIGFITGTIYWGSLKSVEAEAKKSDDKIAAEHKVDIGEIRKENTAAINKLTDMQTKTLSTVSRIEGLLSAANIISAGARSDATTRYNDEEKRRVQ